MTRAAWLLAAPALWATYTWGAHVLAFDGRRRGRPIGPAAALTFDDGPDPEHTPAVLDVLARERVRASFFLIGRRALASPDIARRIAAEGHDLGNHTWSHRSLWTCGPSGTRAEIERGHEAVAAAAGTPPRFFRPPWGMANLAMGAVLRRLGTPAISWSVQTEGLRPVSPETQVRRAAARARSGAILDLHDADGVAGAGRRLAQALPALIDALRRRGLDLVPLRELL